MAGSIFYQSVGNPVQRARLPKRPMSLAFALPQRATASQRRRLKRIVLAFLLVAVLPAIPYLQFEVPGLYLPAVIVAGGILLWWKYGIFPAVSGRDIALTVGVALAFAVLLALPIRVAVIAVALGLLTRCFAEHFLAERTCSPTGSENAAAFRKSANGYLSVVQIVPTVALVLSMITDSWLIPFFSFATFLIWQAVQSGHHQSGGWTTLNAALVSWLDYNRFGTEVPGTHQSPAGPWFRRVCMMAVGVLMIASIAVPMISAVVVAMSSLVPIAIPGIGIFSIAIGVAVSVIVALHLPGVLVLPLLREAADFGASSDQDSSWKSIVSHLRHSRNPIERRSVFMGRVLEDGSPVIVPKETFREHGHFLGDTGTGKTSLGFLPLIEQLMGGGDCSVVVVDLKGDSRELLTTMQCAAEQAERTTHKQIPVRHFSNQVGRSTFAFNPLTQPHWSEFELYTRTDILCAAMGLNYGSDYGQGFYSSTNAGVLYHTMRTYPDLNTFRDLADRVGYVAVNAKKRELHPEVRRAGVHVHEVLKRLGSFEAMNVTNGRHANDVMREAIDMADVFTNPQGLYFQLPSTLAPGSSPEIARLVVYFLLSAAARTDRKHQVYLVIDEFQRMVASNIEYILQLARSMDVSVILANQSMEDLRTSSSNLIPTIDANCRYRQWFGASAMEDRQRIIDSSGETIRTLRSVSNGGNSNGGTWSITEQEQFTPRLTSNHILLMSDHPKQSVVRISRGAGYAQYGGMPFIVESDFHISPSEYERRRWLPWPENAAGTFVPQAGGFEQSVPDHARFAGLELTKEVIGVEEGTPRTSVPNPFASFLEARAEHKESKPQRRRRKRHDAD